MPAVNPVPDGEVAPGGIFGGSLGNVLSQFVRLIVVFTVTQWAFKRAVPDANSYADGGRRNGVVPGTKGPALKPSYSHGELIDMWVYITETPGMGDFHDPEGTSLVWTETGIPLGEDRERTMHIDIPTPQHVLNNGTMYVHSFFTRTGLSPDPRAPNYDRSATFGRTTTLVKYVKPRKKSKKKNLLGSGEEEEEEEEEDDATAVAVDEEDEDAAMELWEPHWKPNCTINLVDDYTVFEGMQVPATIKPHMHVDPHTNAYFPVVFYNDFWLLNDKYIKFNSTTESLPLTLHFGSINLFKWQMMMQMEESFRMQKQMGSMSEGESDELKRVLIEGNPYLLGLTGCVSLLHTVFDLLAFKNDIGFWKKNKSMEGLSLRSIMVSCFCQVVILLYLFDNDTSWMILFSSTLGVFIEFWKLTKAMHVNFSLAKGLTFKSRDSYAKSDTQKWDAEAMQYMSYVMYPLIGCYAIYSVVYNEHKGWYSFVLSTLVGCVYAFGFIMMCPQLYINWKMKSVAHLPWRQMTYKFLNTIIDDLFAFVIKMPTLHRLSVFRDDLIFLIYLYQRWKYPVDKSRVNEFGFSDEAPAGAEQVEGATDASKALEDAKEGGGTEEGGQDKAGGASAEDEAKAKEPKKDK